MNWSFMLRPRWLASHAFALSLMALFVVAGFWQLDRRSERSETNAEIESRAAAPEVTVADALATLPAGVGVEEAGELLDYVVVADQGRFIEPVAVRVANRSQNGLAGDWIVGLYQTEDDVAILVNRGFLPRDVEPGSIEAGQLGLQGWLRPSHEKGPLGATDTGAGERAPRLDVTAIAARIDFDGDLAPVWVQMAGTSDQGQPPIPEPVPLPPRDNGPHLSYAVQWFTFTVMSAGVYGLVLRRQARRRPAI